MLAVSSPPPLRSTRSDESQGELMENNFSMGTTDEEYFGELSEGNLLESINFDDLFDGDILPDLEMDPEMLAEFSSSLSTGGAGEEYSEMNSSSVSVANNNNNIVVTCTKKVEEEEEKAASSDSGTSSRGEEIMMSKRDESVVVNPSPNKEGTTEKGRKSSSTQSKNNPQGKRKVKVDWTPELHRRFVQAVEQLGVEKAVPSRILEIMGIDCLTRHNIASHLQKYRSHRKHLLAREAEAASWSLRRQLYGASTRGGGGKRDVNPWLAVLPPTMGFPPPPPMTPPPPPMHHFRVPLHVWGHHTMDQSFIHMWPKHLPYSPPQPAWAPLTPPPPPDPSYWHQRAPNAPITPGTPCFPQPALTTARFGSPTVPGIPRPHAMYQVDPGSIGVPSGQPSPSPLLDFHPSKESIDAAIGDVLSKPWLPLPLGLKAPALDGVMGELQRQGVPKIPPSCA